MKFILESDNQESTLISRVVGDLYAQETAMMGLQCRTVACDNKQKLILDFRKSNLKINLIEAHHWFSKYYADKGLDLKKMKTAHLYDEKDKALFSFIEDSWANQMINTRVFKDQELALEWLNSENDFFTF